MRTATHSALCVISLALGACAARPTPHPPPPASDPTANEATAAEATAADVELALPSCGPIPPGVVIEPAPLVDELPAHPAHRDAEALLALCVAGSWHLVPLEGRQLTDGDGFEVSITHAEAVDRTGDGERELEVAFHVIESLTALPPAGPYRRADGVVLLSLSSQTPREVLRFYLSGRTDTAVAYGEAQMVGAAQWVDAAEGPILSVVQTVATTEDSVDDDGGGGDHGAPQTRVEVFEATSRRDDGSLVFDSEALWRPLIPGL